ncbi:6230_t:CDS:2 [Rhizophagus irregularis]|nr:6230_t:CDS:2 [Rhizophagus irregularis]
MELDAWCICGKLVLDNNALYCSNECKNADSNNSIPSSYHQSQNPQNPPMNLHFSITITPNMYKASDSNAKISSPSLSTLDQNFNDNYNYLYTRCCNQFEDDTFDNDYYTSYYSTSNPIDIPSPRTQAASDPALEPNKGTFGKEKSLFS